MMFFIGITMARLLWSGSFGFFIQQRMQIPLMLAAAGLVLAGIYEGRAALRDEAADESALRRAVAPRVGWLMVLPLVVLVSVAPTGLGAAAAERVEPFTPVEVSTNFEPIDTSAGPAELRVIDFVDRAIWDTEGSIEGIAIRLEGLVVNSPEIDDGFLLTRFLVSCCAADGVPVQVALRGLDTPFEDDQWVVADVIFQPPDEPFRSLPVNERLVEAEVISISVNPNPPTDAYESPY